MRISDWNDPIWKTVINNAMLNECILPEKSLYWLSGGEKEWNSLNNYKYSWSNCYSEFQEEFGILIIDIVKKSKTLLDIRNSFVKYLNLPILYNFAISKNIVR